MAINIQNVRGTNDILVDEAKKWQKVESVIKQFCLLYDYKEIRTPIFEDTKVFKRENDSSDMVNKEMYTFSINGKDSLTLRPEGTASVIRSFVQHKLYGKEELPAKYSYMGPMFRYERPQKGRQRQFHQFGIEALGPKSPLMDAETIIFGFSMLKALGIDNIEVLINTLGDDESRANYKEALKAYFKPYLGELCGDCQRRFEQNPLRLLDCKVDSQHECMKNVIKMDDYMSTESKDYFSQVLSALDSLEIPYKVDSKLVRGLDYYTHTVFEIVSTLEASGSQATVLAGGRYDNLVEYFNGPQISGVGFAMGLERLMIIIDALNIDLNETTDLDCYVMTLGNVGSAGLGITTMLRSFGYITDFNQQERSLKAQFKSVDRKKARFAIIVGESELENNEVVVKDTLNKTQENINIDELIDYLDSLNGGNGHE